jgi:hypothetical protein
MIRKAGQRGGPPGRKAPVDVGLNVHRLTDFAIPGRNHTYARLLELRPPEVYRIRCGRWILLDELVDSFFDQRAFLLLKF